MVVTECYPHPGGMHRCAFAHRQLVGAKQAGWDIQVRVPNGWFPRVAWRVARSWRHVQKLSIPRDWTLDGISVADLAYENRVPDRVFGRRPLRERIARAAVTQARRLGADILMVQFALPYGPSIRDAAHRLATPFVVQLRGDDVWVWPHRNDEAMQSFRETVRSAQLVTGVCRALLDEAERLVGAPLPKAAVVPNGIDLQRYRPPLDARERERIRAQLDLRDQDLVIFCVADTIVRKGWLDLLDALGGLHGLSRIVLCGAAQSQVAEFDLLAEAKRRAPHVETRLERGLSAEELAVRYRAADVFCLPSHWEGLANALLEAMASGLPSVTTAVSGHPEVVTDGVDGWLVGAQSVYQLRDRLREVLANRDLRLAVGAAARARAEAVGDSARAGARLAALLECARDGRVCQELLAADPYAPPVASW